MAILHFFSRRVSLNMGNTIFVLLSLVVLNIVGEEELNCQ